MLLPLLIAAHLIGDWIVQTDYQAANKTSSWKVNQQHMLGYHIVLTLFIALVAGWWTLPIVAVSWLTHSLIDRRWPVKKLMVLTKSEPFSNTTFGMIAVDQALHIAILCLLSLLC